MRKLFAILFASLFVYPVRLFAAKQSLKLKPVKSFLKTLFVVVMLSNGANYAFAQTFFSEDFESGTLGTFSNSGTITTLTWGNTTIRGTDPGHSATRSAYFGNPADTSYNTGFIEGADLISSAINLTGALSPNLSFNYFLETENGAGWDIASFSISTDSITFVTIADNDVTGNLVDASGIWQSLTLDISAYAGSPTVYLRFSFNTVDDFVNNFEGFFVDDVLIDQLLVNDDVGVIAIDAPVSGCSLSATEAVTVRVKNFGTVAQSSIPVSFDDGTGAVTETIPGPLNPGDTITYTFTATSNLSVSGTYFFDAWTSLAGDANNSNDSLNNYQVDQLTINIFPYFEDFETLIDGETGLLSNFWEGIPSTGFRWEANAFGTPTSNTGPTGDHTTGAGIYLYTEASSGGTGDIADLLTTSCIDISSLTLPTLSFWYHMYGSDMGNLFIDVYSAGVWTTVDSLMGQQQTVQTDPWLQRVVDLSSFSGIIQIRFRGIRGTGSMGDMSIDDINIYEPLTDDVGVIAIDAPASGCGLSAAENVTVRVKNFGIAAQSNIPVSFDDGTGAVTETIPGPLNPGDTITYTFTATSNLSVSGTYFFDAWTSLAGDANNSNDSLNNYQVDNLTISTFPYVEDFETLIDGETGLLSNSWEGIPSTGFRWEANAFGTLSSNTGPTGDHTTGTGIYLYTEATSGATGDIADLLTTSCIDISSITLPILSFWYHMYGSDMGNLFIDVYSAGVWTTVDSLIGQQQTVQTDPWLQRVVDLSSFSGIIQIRFSGIRGTGYMGDMSIDDINIYEPLTDDVGVIAIDAPASGCGLNATENVTVRVKNFGIAVQSSIPVSFNDGTGAVTETIPGSLNPGDTISYTFTATSDLSLIGTYTFNAWTGLVGDEDGNNDSITNYQAMNNCYCIPVYTDGCAAFSDYIDRVEFAGIDNSPVGTGCNSNNYIFYSGDTAKVIRVSSYAITLTHNLAKSNGFGVWIDFNADNDFADAGEFVFASLNDFSPKNGIINIPITATLGITRMRVRNTWNATLTDADSCSSLTWGETEDYYVLIQVQPANDVGVIAIDAPTTGCGLTSTETVTVRVMNFGIAVQSNIPVSFDDGTGVITETIPDSLTPGDTISYTFTTTSDMSITGLYTFDAWTSLVTDGNSSNDSITNYLVNTIIVFDEFTAQTGSIASVGETGSNFFGQSFFANVSVISEVGVWLQENIVEGEVRIAIAPDDGSGNPDESAVLWESALLNPSLVGQWFTISGLVIPVTFGTKYWVLIDGMNIGATGNSNVGTATDNTDTGENFKYSNDGGVSWFTWSVPLAISVSSTCPVSIDGGISSIISPFTDCGLTNSETVTVNVQNFGLNTIFSIDVYYSINGGPPVIEPINDTILPGSGLLYSFSTPADLSLSGVYIIDAWTQLTGDIVSLNDSLTNYQVENIAPITAFPYFEDFETEAQCTDGCGDPCPLSGIWIQSLNDDIDWTVDSNNTSSLVGPLVDHTIGDATGNYIYTEATGSCNPSMEAILISTCFDISALINPTLSFWYFMYDGSTGNMGNLYTDIYSGGAWITVDSLIGAQQPVQTNPWLKAIVNLSAFSGIIKVRFRGITGSGYQSDMAIDDINIEGQILDVGVVAFNAPITSCGLTANESVAVWVKNFGNDSISTIPVSYRLNGGGPLVEVITATIPPGDSILFTFTSTSDLSVTGTYIFDAWTGLAGDINNANDSLLNYSIDNISAPVVNLGNDTSVCNNLILDPGYPGSAYSWSTGDSSQSIAVSVTGTYGVEVIVPGCTPVYDTINVTVNFDPVINLGNDTTFCGDSISLDASNAGSTYSWQDSSSNQTLTATASGIYWVDVTTISGCTSRDSISITMYSIPIVDLGNDTAVCESFILDAGNTGLLFSWNIGDTSQTILVTTNGSYNVTVTSIDGCSSSDTANIIINTNPTVTLGSDTAVCNDTISLNAENPGATYLWSTGDTTQTINVDTTSFYYVEVTDSNGCSSTDTILVIVNTNPPIVDIGPDTTVCGGIILDAGINLGSTFTWNTGDTTQIVNITLSGTFSIDVTNNCGSVSDSIDIIVYPIPVVNIGNDTLICTGDTLTLDAGNSGMSYLWSTTDTTQTITIDTSGNYSVEVTDTTGCFLSDTISVTVSSGPTAAFTTTISGLTVFFDATSSIDATSGFIWDFGDGAGTSTQDTVTYTYTADSTYDVKLVAFNPCGSDTSIIPVTVIATGIVENIIATGQINIYPNPNEGIFTVSFTGFGNEKVQLTILDMQGRSVVNEQLTVNSEFNKEVDLSRLPKGMYFMRVYTIDKVFTKKILVE